MNQHTPGSWTVGAIHGGLIDIEAYIGAVKLRVGQIIRAKDGIGHANARLIAAAPDLLEALTQIVQAEESRWGFFGRINKTQLATARAAIAKATIGEVNGI